MHTHERVQVYLEGDPEKNNDDDNQVEEHADIDRLVLSQHGEIIIPGSKGNCKPEGVDRPEHCAEIFRVSNFEKLGAENREDHEEDGT